MPRSESQSQNPARVRLREQNLAQTIIHRDGLTALAELRRITGMMSPYVLAEAVKEKLAREIELRGLYPNRKEGA